MKKTHFAHVASKSSICLASCILAMATTGAHADVVLAWNDILCQAVQAEGNSAGNANPGWSTRAMAMLNGAMYDVLQATNRTHASFHYNASSSTASGQVAAAQAARDILVATYPSQTVFADAMLASQLAGITDNAAKSEGISLGSAAATSYLSWRTADGAATSVPYTVTNAPGHWSPDPLHPSQNAWGPAWGAVQTFAVSSSSSFAPPAPPTLGSAAYATSYNQVKNLGALNSTSRTDEQTQIGLFWAYDRPTMGPPPVLYMRNLGEIAVQQGNTEAQNALLFAAASIAMADAAIVAWDAKFESDLWRPITAIRGGELDGNTATIGDVNWVPLGAPGADPLAIGDDFTPPFPAYISGHATMGAAVFTSLENFYGTDNVNFTLSSSELIGITRDYTSFTQASDENALSRVYLGIHWDFDSIEGQKVGSAIANDISARLFTAVPEPANASLISLGLLTLLRRRRTSGLLGSCKLICSKP